MLSKAPEQGWAGSKGRCNKDIFERYLFPAADDCLALLCGPPAMEVRGNRWNRCTPHKAYPPHGCTVQASCMMR